MAGFPSQALTEGISVSCTEPSSPSLTSCREVNIKREFGDINKVQRKKETFKDRQAEQIHFSLS